MRSFYDQAALWAPLLVLYIQVIASFAARFLARSLFKKLEDRPAPRLQRTTLPRGPEMVMAAVALDLASLFIPTSRVLAAASQPERFISAFTFVLITLHLVLYVFAQLFELRELEHAYEDRDNQSYDRFRSNPLGEVRSKFLGAMIGFLAMITNGWTLRFLLTVSGT